MKKSTKKMTKYAQELIAKNSWFTTRIRLASELGASDLELQVAIAHISLEILIECLQKNINYIATYYRVLPPRQGRGLYNADLIIDGKWYVHVDNPNFHQFIKNAEMC